MTDVSDVSETGPEQPGAGDLWGRLADGVVELRKRRPAGRADGSADGTNPADPRFRIAVETCGCEGMGADPGGSVRE
ncbi:MULTISPECIES: hypothetical protein [unclassified Streptomyces]|uniref:hypothetical protein n=1 Tax=unclassified Streptomyces TaxID=2593676 RepID=UPI003667D4D5